MPVIMRDAGSSHICDVAWIRTIFVRTAGWRRFWYKQQQPAFPLRCVRGRHGFRCRRRLLLELSTSAARAIRARCAWALVTPVR